MNARTADPAPLVRVVDRIVATGGAERPAILTDGEPVSYGSLLRMIRVVAWRLQTLGVRREDRVVVELDDCPEMVAIVLGAMRIGAVPVLINPWAGIAGYALEHSRARLWVTDAADAVAAGCPAVAAGALVAEPAEGLGTQVTAVTVDAEDVALWLYSSGSTGQPKAVVHLHRDIEGSCTGYAGDVLGLRAEDVVFSSAKMFHAYGLGGGLLFPLWHGASVVFLRGRPGPQGVVRTVERFRPTVLFSVPGLYNAVLRQAETTAVHLDSLRICVSAAEPLAAAVWHRWRDRFGVEILDGVGSTEMLHIYCSNRPGRARPDSAGHAVPGYELEVRPHPGAPESAGELWVRGPSTFDRYWRDQDATRAAFCGGWFRTGDCFTVEDGRYRFLGRLDDLMKIGGQWVPAHPIESELLSHPDVAEAAVVAVSSGTMNRIRAFVVPARAVTGAEATALTTELRRWCARQLPPGRIPHQFELIESLPKTPAGKVRRFLLRERAGLSPAR